MYESRIAKGNGISGFQEVKIGQRVPQTHSWHEEFILFEAADIDLYSIFMSFYEF